MYAPDSQSLFSYPGYVPIMGDFKAHDASWHFSTLDERAANRGVEIVNTLENWTSIVINQDPLIRKPSNCISSSPDFTITDFSRATYPSSSVWKDDFLNTLNLCLPVQLISEGYTGNSSQTKWKRLSVASQCQHHVSWWKSFPRSFTSSYKAEYLSWKKFKLHPWIYGKGALAFWSNRHLLRYSSLGSLVQCQGLLLSKLALFTCIPALLFG